MFCCLLLFSGRTSSHTEVMVIWITLHLVANLPFLSNLFTGSIKPAQDQQVLCSLLATCICLDHSLFCFSGEKLFSGVLDTDNAKWIRNNVPSWRALVFFQGSVHSWNRSSHLKIKLSTFSESYIFFPTSPLQGNSVIL